MFRPQGALPAGIYYDIMASDHTIRGWCHSIVGKGVMDDV